MTPDPFSSRELGGGLGTRLINRQRGGGGSLIERTHFIHALLFLSKSGYAFRLANVQMFETPGLEAETERSCL